eukprot:scaffold11929_cov107-Isochrysis_galbana.AAC.13
MCASAHNRTRRMTPDCALWLRHESRRVSVDGPEKRKNNANPHPRSKSVVQLLSFSSRPAHSTLAPPACPNASVRLTCPGLHVQVLQRTGLHQEPLHALSHARLGRLLLYPEGPPAHEGAAAAQEVSCAIS